MKEHKLIKLNWHGFNHLAIILKRVCDQYSFNFHVRTLAEKITDGTANFPKKVYQGTNLLFKRFTHNKDPKGREFLQTPEYLAKKIMTEGRWSGDCDDVSVFLLSLYRSIGFDGYMVFVSPVINPPYTHTLPVIECPTGELIKVDFLTNGNIAYQGKIRAFKIK